MTSPFTGTIYEPYDFQTDSSHVLVIHADPNITRSPALRGPVLPREQMQLLSGACFSIIRSALPDSVELSTLPIEGFLTMGVGITFARVMTEQDELEFLSGLEEMLLRALAEIEADLGISLSLAVSALHTNTRNVYDAYQEAFSIAVHYCFLTTPPQIIFYQRFQTGLSPSERNSKKLLEQQFQAYMNEERYPEAEPVLLQLITLRASAARTVISLTQELIARLGYYAYQLVDGHGLPASSQEQIIDRIDRIRSAKSLEELSGHIHEILLHFDRLLHSSEKAGDASWSGRISDYIRNHYADPTLNAAVLGQIFGLNPAYLSHVFHLGGGVKLVDYLHLTRLGHVKEMLARTSMSLAQIAGQTGYIDTRAMSRVFRRYVGMTPSDYRKRMRKPGA